jgi:hypothetical protein
VAVQSLEAQPAAPAAIQFGARLQD